MSLGANIRHFRKRLASKSLFAVVGVVALIASLNKDAFAERLEGESINRISETVKYLASDELEGRGPGTSGIDEAADFIAKQFRTAGLGASPLGGNGFQEFEISDTASMGPREQNRLVFTGPDGESSLTLDADFRPLAVGGTVSFDVPIVFAGYGITAPELHYDDYAGIDAKGKAVIILRKEPQQTNPHSVFNGSKNTQHATFRRKLSNANEHGAACVILVNDMQELKQQRKTNADQRKKAAAALAEANKQIETAQAKDADPNDIESLKFQAKRIADRIKSLEEAEKQDFDVLLPFAAAGPSTTHRKLPVFFARRAAVDAVIKASLKSDLDSLEQKIDEDLKSVSAELTDWKASGESNVVTRKLAVKNVVGVLEGEGPHADETIVIGAHYDHLGFGGAGSLAPWTRAIHNGADDNASGVAVLIELARQFASREKPPARRLVFIAFTGEERGLLGSAHYASNPLFPLESTVAMVNLDMVGRLNDNKLIVQGGATAKEFEALLDKLNEQHQFKLIKKPGGMGPSDHSSFYAKKVPAFHIFTDLHKNYHRPSDDFETLNLEGMDRISKFTLDLVQQLDQMDNRPTYVAIKKKPVEARTGSRPYLGSIPDFGREVDGYAIQGTSPGGPADKAGMKSGDAIIKFGDSKISGLEDIDSALRKFKAGDKVPVVVLRDGKEVKLIVELGQPRE